MEETLKVVLIDDETDLCDAVGKVMIRAGFSFESAHTGKDGMEKVHKHMPDVVILDMVLPDTTGLTVLKQLKEFEPDLPVIVLTGHENVKSAVEMMKDGAYTYMSKPFSNDELEITVRHAADTWRLLKEVRYLRLKVNSWLAERGLFTLSESMKRVAKLIELVSPTDATVLLLGESGTGKELIANAIHKVSSRAGGPFVPVDLTSCPETLVESELFGHERGAFTGAVTGRPGKVEMADRGTLFLDEIGNLPTNIQAKLLRMLEGRKIERLGGRKEIPVNIRVIAATNIDLKKAIEKDLFRADLYHRLNEFLIQIPPLRERPEDILLLVDHFIRSFNEEMRKSITGISSEALKKLSDYSWPGNVRELKNTIKRCMVLASKRITASDLPPEIKDVASSTLSLPHNMGLKNALKEMTKDAERNLIIDALKRAGGKRGVAAKMLDIDEKTLYNKMKEYGIFLGGG